MKRFGFALIAIGFVVISISAMADIVGLGNTGQLGAAQILGIDIGILLFLIGVGCAMINYDWALGTRIRKLPEKILQISPNYWILSTFLLLYVLFFLFPVFFSKLRIQYFVRYIPYEWVTFIGNDILWTVDHIEQWFTLGQSPFTAFFYPPLTVFIFAPLVLLGYPGYYWLITIVTLLSYIFATLLIPILISPRKNSSLIFLFFITGLFSYGFQFEMDRGQFNLIAFTVCFLAIYLFHYHPRFKYFSYLLFSLGVQLKMYPIIFVVMLVTDWQKWVENLKRLFGLIFFNISLLFVLGVQVFLDFVRNLTSAQLYFQSSRREDLSITGFVLNLTEDGFGLIPPARLSNLATNSGLVEVTFLIIFALCLFSILIHTYRRNLKGINVYLLIICSVGALIIPSASVDYKLPLLVAPIAILLTNLPPVHGYSKKAISIVLIVVISIAYWSTLYPFTVKPYILSRNFPALFIIMISVTFLYFLLGGRSRINVVES